MMSRQDQSRRISTEKKVTQVHTFHSFVKSKESDHDKRKVAKLYDDWTGSYEEDVKKVGYKGATQTGVYMSEYCPDKTISILDCGAGTGLVGIELHSRGFTNITATDISQNSLDIAKGKGVYNRVILTDGSEKPMPFKEDEFDALACVGCFIPGHMNQEVFPDWIRVIKPGGLIFLVMRESYLREAEFKDDQFYNAVQELVDSKRWTRVATKTIPDYFDLYEGIAFIFKVL